MYVYARIPMKKRFGKIGGRVIPGQSETIYGIAKNNLRHPKIFPFDDVQKFE